MIPEYWLQHPFVAATGWTVLHALWQATLIAGLLWVVFYLGRKWRPEYRYWLGMAALLLQVGWSGATFVEHLPVESSTAIAVWSSASSAAPAVVAPAIAVPIISESLSIPDFLQLRLAPYLPYFALAWLIGLSLVATRFGIGLYQVRQLRTHGVSPVPASIDQLFRSILQRTRTGRRVALALSDRIDGPLLLGQLKPLILVPGSLVTQLSTEELEAVLLHELAHLRRYDYFWNLVQSTIECLFHFHPAVWWISHAVRLEREHCCDDFAVRHCASKLQYAKSLLRVAETRQSRLGLALAGPRYSLLGRVKRLLQPQKNHSMKTNNWLLALPLLLLFGLALAPASSEAETNAAETTLFPPELPLYVSIDTLPKGNIQFSIRDEEKDVQVKVKDRRIEELRIDGEDIPASDFPEYETMVEELLSRVPPAPPAPPTPPAPSAFPAPPAPPAPPVPGVAPAPPAPPAPPAARGGIYFEEGPGQAYRFRFDRDRIFEVTPPGTVRFFSPGEDAIVWLDADGETVMVDSLIDKSFGMAFSAMDLDFDFPDPEILTRVHVFGDTIDPKKRKLIEEEVREAMEHSREVIEMQRQEMELVKEEMMRRREEIQREMEERQNMTEAERREWREEFERERMHEQRALEEQQRALSREQARAFRDQERALARVREQAQASAERAEALRWRTAALTARGTSKMAVILDQLNRVKAEGLIDVDRIESIDLSEKSLKVNGKRQSKEAHRRFLQLYEAATGKPFSGKLETDML